MQKRRWQFSLWWLFYISVLHQVFLGGWAFGLHTNQVRREALDAAEAELANVRAHRDDLIEQLGGSQARSSWDDGDL